MTAADLKHIPLILPRRSAVQSELANWFGRRYRHLNILFTSNLSTNAAIMVQNGLGCSLVIEGSVPFWSHEEVTYRPLFSNLINVAGNLLGALSFTRAWHGLP